MGGLTGDVSEEPMTQEKRRKGWRMSCDVGEATEGLEKLVPQVKRRMGWRMSCDVGEATESLENELCFRFSYGTNSSLGRQLFAMKTKHVTKTFLKCIFLVQYLLVPEIGFSEHWYLISKYSCQFRLLNHLYYFNSRDFRHHTYSRFTHERETDSLVHSKFYAGPTNMTEKKY